MREREGQTEKDGAKLWICVWKWKRIAVTAALRAAPTGAAEPPLVLLLLLLLRLLIRDFSLLAAGQDRARIVFVVPVWLESVD